MQSLKQLFRTGHGPSSSHTMGPSNAAKILTDKYPNADSYIVTLYNSLALTGKGHLTDVAISNQLFDKTVEFNFVIDDKKHPNTILFDIYENKKLIISQEVYSVGGGRILFKDIEEIDKSIYIHSLFDDIHAYCKENNITLYDYVVLNEGKDIDEFLLSVWSDMKNSIHDGLNITGVLPGTLRVPRKAKILNSKRLKFEAPEITENRLISAYAFAVSEQNASGGKVVTAPTCGACGVLPSVLYYMQNKYNFSDKKIIEALAVAGLIGNLIKHNASISGAEAGCQAEIGSACSMAAAAHATLFNLSIDQVEYAAEIAMEHHLGLTCDPIGGYVQIPCIERNAVAALRAIDSCSLAFFLSDYKMISLDTVISTMYQTGKDMHPDYKETSKGGLAKHYTTKNNVKTCW